MARRAPLLYDVLHGFCLGTFADLLRDVEAGAEIPFAFDEHGARGAPVLYEYRPLMRDFVEARADRIASREDARLALAELAREPAAAIFARAHAGPRPSEVEALFRTVLMPLLVATAEGCGGFDWADEAFERAYASLETSLFADERTYAAIAPLVGLSAGAQVELGAGIRVRVAVAGELAAHWPEASRLAPRDFGREPDRRCVLELERRLEAGVTEPPDGPGELADAMTALRLATAGAIAAGPVLFERLDWRPYGIRPMLPIAASEPPGEPTRLDRFRGRLAADLLERLVLADEDPELAEALDRWELSLFQAEPFRSEQLREALTALLGGEEGPFAAALRASILLGDTPAERWAALAELRELVGGEAATRAAADAVRRSLVEALVRGDRSSLIGALDEALVGLRPRPATVALARAVTG